MVLGLRIVLVHRVVRLVEHREIHQRQVGDVDREVPFLLDFGDRPVGDREAQSPGSGAGDDHQ